MLNSATSPKPQQAPSIVVTIASVAIACLFSLLATGHAYAKDDDESARSILDRPLQQGNERAHANNRGNGNGNNGNGNGNSGNHPVRDQAASELRNERAQLKSNNENQLRAMAAKGERLAQLVLAETLADEAQQLIGSPMMANDALSEALSWYAVAARRGQTNDQATLAIDSLIPAPAIRAIRSPR